MKFNTIHTDRPSLSAADVAAGQSFQALMKQASPKSWYQTGWFYATSGLAVLGIAAVVALQLLPAGEPQRVSSEQAAVPALVIESDSTQSVVAPLVSPPLGDLMPQTVQTCNADQGGTYTLGSSKVVVPPACFVNASGAPISGKVDLTYTECRDKGDLWLSGIPMAYDSAGTTYTFESDGMFELRGHQAGTEVFVAPNKAIEVQMQRVKGGNAFSQYALNEASGAWDYIQPATLKPAPEIEGVDEELWDTQVVPVPYEIEVSDTPQLVAPVAPKVAKDEHYQIQLSYHPGVYPELQALGDVLFEVGESDLEEALSQSKKSWTQFDLKRKNEGDWYTLTFSNNAEEYVVDAYPVIQASGMEVAQAEFEKSLAAFESEKGARQQRQADQKRQGEARIAQRLQQGGNQVESAITEVFMLKRFGIYNSDCPRNLPKGAVAHRAFVDRNGDALYGSTGVVMLADNERNAVYRLYNNARLQFNPRNTSAAWFVTRSGDLAIARHRDLLLSSSTKTPVVCNVVPVAGMGVAELKAVIDQALRPEEVN